MDFFGSSPADSSGRSFFLVVHTITLTPASCMAAKIVGTRTYLLSFIIRSTPRSEVSEALVTSEEQR